MGRFRELMRVALLSGLLAGLALFAVQRVTVIPLLEEAERYESAAAARESIVSARESAPALQPAASAHAALAHPPGTVARQAASSAPEPAAPARGSAAPDSAGRHDHPEWAPGEGWERTAWTAAATVLIGIGFSALLFGFLDLAGAPLTPVRGALWGLAAFACIHLAPAAGLPPLPPGSAAADLGERQLWSAATVAATALGLWLLAGRGHAWPLRVAGLALILAPHVYGAPAPVGRNLAPPPLMRRFAAASLATTCLFWLLAGAIGGWMRRQRKH